KNTDIFNFYNSHDLFLIPQSLQSNPVPVTAPASPVPVLPYAPQYHWSPDAESPTVSHLQCWNQFPPHGSLVLDASRYNPAWPSQDVLCSDHTFCKTRLARQVLENQSARFEYVA